VKKEVLINTALGMPGVDNEEISNRAKVSFLAHYPLHILHIQYKHKSKMEVYVG